MQKVVGLQDHVGELGVADALVAVVESLAHRVALDHRIDREVLSDIAQHVDKAQLAQPRQVVLKLGPVAAREVKQALEDLALRGDVGLDELRRHQLSLCRLAGRVADKTGATAQQDHRLMTCALPVHQQLDRNKVANGQRVRRGVKARICPSRAACKMRAELRLVGHLMQQATPAQLF